MWGQETSVKTPEHRSVILCAHRAFAQLLPTPHPTPAHLQISAETPPPAKHPPPALSAGLGPFQRLSLWPQVAFSGATVCVIPMAVTVTSAFPPQVLAQEGPTHPLFPTGIYSEGGVAEMESLPCIPSITSVKCDQHTLSAELSLGRRPADTISVRGT